MKYANPSTILITGASSGIGAALAIYYARPGVTLHLTARNAERLATVVHQCEANGAKVHTAIVDVREREALAHWIHQQDTASPLDLVIANAGISAGTGGQTESHAQVRDIFATNVDGVLNTIQPASERMVSRRKGQLAIVSSLAGIRALPSSPAYSASKAAVRYYGEALRGELKKYNVSVSVICPGYVTTPMTAVNDFPMPFLMSPEEAAGRIAHGLRLAKPRIAFPLRLYLPLWWLSCLSPRITNPLFDALPAKPAQRDKP